MLNKEDILALALEYSEGSGKRYTFTEEDLFAFLKELKKEPVPAQTDQQPEQSGLEEALAAFVALAEDRLHELGALSPEMAECLTNGRAALSAQETNKI